MEVANKAYFDSYLGNETTLNSVKIDGFQQQKILGMYSSGEWRVVKTEQTVNTVGPQSIIFTGKY